MGQARKSMDRHGALGDMIVYAAVLSVFLFLLVFHAVCAFVATGFASRGFAGDWQTVLAGYLKDWSFARWSVGVPFVLLCLQYLHFRRMDWNASR